MHRFENVIVFSVACKLTEKMYGCVDITIKGVNECIFAKTKSLKLSSPISLTGIAYAAIAFLFLATSCRTNGFEIRWHIENGNDDLSETLTRDFTKLML